MNLLQRPILRAILLSAAVFLKPADSLARTWTDLSGRTIDAVLLSCDGKTVVLKSNKSGKEIKVAINRLSISDKAVALFHFHEQKVKAAAEANPVVPPEAPKSQPSPAHHQPKQPAPPDSTSTAAKPDVDKETSHISNPFHLEEFIKGFQGGPESKSPETPDDLDAFMKSLDVGDYAGLIRGVGWGMFLLGMLSLVTIGVLIATTGIYLVSVFLNFKETFGTAVMFGIGSTAIRAFSEIFQAVMIIVAPSAAPTLNSPLTGWVVIIAIYYPFDAFLIRRIYRADLQTASKAAMAYFVWNRIATRIVFALMAAGTLWLASSYGDAGLPPALAE